MSNSNLNNSKSPFDSIRHLDEKGQEFWYATELLAILGYKSWRRQKDTVERAVISCSNSGNNSTIHFDKVVQMAKIGSSDAYRDVLKDYKLTRLACYLVAMNGDPRKPEIASAQSYFAVKTREAELQENKPHLPQTYKEALKALIAEIETKELLEAEKALLEAENNKLAEAVDELFEYSSIIRVAKYNDVSETSFNWRLLKAASLKLNLEIKKVPSPRFEYQNLYSHQAWRLAYPEYRLPETTTLVIAAPV